MAIREDIAAYLPRNAQEAQDKLLFLSFLDGHDDAFSRENRVAHLTASAWVTNRNRTKVLMVYHKLYDSWSWCGGHADGERDLLQVALKECREETGLQNVRPIDGKIASLECLTVDGHEKRGQYVSSHLHLNVTYLLEADDTEPLHVCEDENTGVRWFTPEEALNASTEPWFVKRIYSKLNARLAELK
ncbi:MAG: NUDIX hydrolase [Oscillospiraceae bacterium]|nr:NUDIX hydrolase [Oscillospiraceae bacterium]